MTIAARREWQILTKISLDERTGHHTSAGDLGVCVANLDADIAALIARGHDTPRAAPAHRVEHDVAGIGKAEDEVLGELVGECGGVLEIERVALAVACRILPDRAAVFERVHCPGLDALEPAAGEPVRAGIDFARVLARNHERLFVKRGGTRL